MRVIVAGVGNVLRSDDGFGVEVATRLMQRDQQPGVTIVETGIAGIQLVQDLMDGYDAAIVIDTVDRGRPPGTVMLIEPDVIDVQLLDHNERYDLLADMHMATPERSLMLARALDVLPDRVWMVGCQPVDVESPAIGLSATVEAAIEPAIVEVERCIRDLFNGEQPPDSGVTA
jgi:hydrogenase maturation protease